MHSLQEPEHQMRNLIQIRFQREMSRVDQVDLRIRQILLKGFGPWRHEDDVVFSPHGQQRDLAFPQISLILWVLCHIRPVVIENVKLDVAIPGAGDEGVVEIPGLRGEG